MSGSTPAARRPRPSPGPDFEQARVLAAASESVAARLEQRMGAFAPLGRAREALVREHPRISSLWPAFSVLNQLAGVPSCSAAPRGAGAQQLAAMAAHALAQVQVGIAAAPRSARCRAVAPAWANLRLAHALPCRLGVAQLRACQLEWQRACDARVDTGVEVRGLRGHQAREQEAPSFVACPPTKRACACTCTLRPGRGPFQARS